MSTAGRRRPPAGQGRVVRLSRFAAPALLPKCDTGRGWRGADFLAALQSLIHAFIGTGCLGRRGAARRGVYSGSQRLTLLLHSAGRKTTAVVLARSWPTFDLSTWAPHPADGTTPPQAHQAPCGGTHNSLPQQTVSFKMAVE